ncbi:zinc finger protein 197 isoform X3 [Labeo rohita]|uniref:zinc finger protein 197 isoform X3 n=1 Tax=Labeo rohita TaxID=84645 RepID=UPI0021E1E2A2|nr:zinc finger protein 197 isoform X3 [Labeo rohita]
MATVQSESEQPLDNKLINGTLAGNKPELQPVSATVADSDAEVCAQSSDVKGTTDPDVPSSPASENSAPHGVALSPRNKDASGMPCNYKSPEDEQNTDVVLQNNKGDLISDAPGTDCDVTSDRLHNENSEQETDKQETEDKTTENVDQESNHAREEEHPPKQDEESTNITEASKSDDEAMQSTEEKTEETGDPKSMEKVKDTTEEKSKVTTEEKSMDNTEEKSKVTTEEKSMDNTEEKSKVTTEEKSMDNTEEIIRDNTEEKVMDNAEEKLKDNTEEKVMDNTEEKEGEDESKSNGVVVKRRKSRLECNECGKKFTRRETYNLHRHFHMHQDEQASLVCKECGITFQHRSDLIKHRSIHKENSQPSPSHSKRSERIYNERSKFQCEHCGMCFSTMMRLRLHVCEQTVEKPFRCPLCRKEFQYRVSINAHMQSHSLDSPYRCLECNKGFQSLGTLHIHQRSHAALKPYGCPDCSMVFRHRYVMEDHRRRHVEERAHLCKICGKSFKYSSLLQQHQYLHTGQKPYNCSYCGKTFAFAQNMRAHFRQHRKISARSEARIANHNVSLVEQAGKENANVEQQRNCPLCPQIFYKASDLRAHMLIHEAEYERMSNGKRFDKVYACQYCPLKFQSESMLQSHSQTHMTNILGLNTTHMTNQVKAVLEKQDDVGMDEEDIDSMPVVGGLEDQSEKKQFRCRDCGKCFRYRSVLELHMRIHNKGYQCQVCKKSFRFSSYLQQHSIIHTGKKPYKCPDCGKDFAFHHNMKTHQRLHQQKPFRCTQCRKGYSDESQLQRHMLSHTGEKPYKCHLCDKSFALAYLLRDHLNTHTGERPHRCQECHKSFPWLSSLLVHQKIHVRKRQGQSHSYPLSIHSQRGRVSTGRRGRPRLDRDNGRTAPLPGRIMSETLLPNMVPHHSRSFDANRHERMQLRSQHLQTRNHSQQVHLQPEWQLQMQPTEELLHSQNPTNLLEAQPSNAVQMQWPGGHLKTILPKNDGLPELMHQQQPSQANVLMSAQPNHYSDISEAEQKGKHSQHHVDRQSPRSIQDPQQSQWPVLCDSVQTSSSSSEDGKVTDFDAPTNSESDKLTLDLQMPNSSGLAKTDMGQIGGVVLAAGATTPWGIKTSLEMSTPVGLQEVPGDSLEKQQSRLIQHLPQQMQVSQQLLQQQLHQPQTQIPPTWVSTAPPNQMGPVNLPYTAARFPLGDRPTMWGFQAAPVVSQTLVNGPVQQGHIRAQQHVALISGQQIPLSQPSTFISPPFPPPALNIPASHPIHSVGRQLPGPLPQGIFFTSQGTISEMPIMPQVTNLPQLAQQTEPHKIGNKMPFAPDHLFQCMICGCSLPGELELQMHYMQHAQRDV